MQSRQIAKSNVVRSAVSAALSLVSSKRTAARQSFLDSGQAVEKIVFCRMSLPWRDAVQPSDTAYSSSEGGEPSPDIRLGKPNVTGDRRRRGSCT
jgi:hypothetical protein